MMEIQVYSLFLTKIIKIIHITAINKVCGMERDSENPIPTIDTEPKKMLQLPISRRKSITLEAEALLL
jgi:hypothetical protein